MTFESYCCDLLLQKYYLQYSVLNSTDEVIFNN